LAQKIGLLRSVGIFWVFLGEFFGYLEWLGPNRKYFSEIEGTAVIFSNMQGPRQNLQKLRGLNAKWQGIMDFSDLFSNGKFDRPGPRRVDRTARLWSTVDRGGTDKRAQWHLGGTWAVGLSVGGGGGRAG
jgi:hypothetical protein